MEASTSKDQNIFVGLPRDRNSRPEMNHEHKFDMVGSLEKKNLEVCKNECVEVDIINYMTDDECSSVQPQSDDATVSSSSFGDTFSDVGNHETDDEVMSQFHGDPAPIRGFGGSGDLFPVRKKRLTSHWRKYIQPLMWRCKWVELQIKKFQSQAVKYDNELDKHDQAKQLKYRNLELEGHCTKSMPYNHDCLREKPMKRKIRKRIEESNAEVYLSQHNLFSFFDRSSNDGVTMDDDQANPATSTDKNVGNEFKVEDELLSLDFRDEYLQRQILWKIEVAQSQVVGIKTRLNTLITENAIRFSSTEDLSLQEPNNMLTCSIKESVPPTNRDGRSVIASFASELMKYNIGDDDLIKPEVKPENADLSHGEGTHVQKDVNEQTEQPPVASRKRSPDKILIYNRRAKKPQADSGAVKIHPIEKLQAPKEEKGNDTAPASVSEESSQNEQPAPKLRSVSKLTAPKNRKKRRARTQRKRGSSLWSRRTSG